MNVDIDLLLKRRLFLQRYVTSLSNDVLDGGKKSDRDLFLLIAEFVASADDKALRALTQLRKSNPSARSFLRDIRKLIDDQKKAAIILISNDIERLVEREAVVVAAALGGGKPSSMRGVATAAIAGSSPSELIDDAFGRYEKRLISEISSNAMTPELLTKLIKGSSSENFKDGLFKWRDRRLIQPNVDLVVNGAASNVAEKVYIDRNVEMVNHLATLDFNVCFRCAAAERGGPYKVGHQPRIPVHPHCRCLNVPHFDGMKFTRPYVKDKRPVKDIPESQRDKKIGQTKLGLDEFFGRLSDADLRAYLGPARFDLWKAGKVSRIRDLVSQANLRPLRLDELPEL